MKEASQSDYLFVYGTLLNKSNYAPGDYIKIHCEYVGNASFPGLLFDLGSYPAAIYDMDSRERVYGELYRISGNKNHLLTNLDEYEGYEYNRKVIAVEQDASIIYAYCYLYNKPPEGLKQIISGDYLGLFGRF